MGAEYINLIENKPSSTILLTENKQNYTLKVADPDDNKLNWSWIPLFRLYTMDNAFNPDENFVADFYIGKSNEESLNFLIDLSAVCDINKILMRSASSIEYFPSKVNFFAGMSINSIFGAEAKPLKRFNDVSENGEYSFEFDVINARFVRIEILENENPYYEDYMVNVISSLAVYGKALENTVEVDRNVSVYPNITVQENMLGFGSNLWLGKPDTNNMTDAYYEVNFKRIKTIRPAFMRMMFFPHWIMDFSLSDEEIQYNWENGIYYFDTPQINLFFKYVQAFKEAGTVVQLNMGGAHDVRIKDWFGIKDIEKAKDAATDPGLKSLETRSAPRDLDAFAKAVSAVISECHRRGLTNVKMLSFYNEVNGTNCPTFAAKPAYWVSMLKRVHNELVKNNLRDKITVLGTEFTGAIDSGSIPYFTDYVKKHAEGYYDVLSTHLYITKHRYPYFKDFLVKPTFKAMPNGYVTEFMNAVKDGVEGSGGEASVWDFGRTEAAQFIAFANEGAAGAAAWYLCGSKIDDPIGVNMNLLENTVWRTPSPDEEGSSRIDEISGVFGEEGLLMRYVPKNGKTIKANSDSDNVRLGGDVLTTAFISGDRKDLTVVLVVKQNESGKERKLSLSVDGFENATMHKVVYNYAEIREIKVFDGNAILPVFQSEHKISDGQIVDTLPEGHSLVIYTTMDEAVQVALKQTELTVGVDESVTLEVDNIYGTDNKAVEWKVLSGNGTVDNTGKYSATGTKSGDTVAVAAISKADKDAYAVAVITVK